MRSLRLTLTLWFALSLVAITIALLVAAHSHLNAELREEKWERTNPKHSDWILHGNYTDQEIHDILGELLRVWLWVGIPLALCSVGIGYWLAHKAGAPVRRLNEQLQTIDASHLHQRARISATDSEYRQLEGHINDLLRRFSDSYAQLNDYATKVAHELRTPLMLMRLQIEHASSRMDPELAESVQEELRRLSNYVESALLAARAEQGRLELRLEPVHVNSFLEEFIEPYRLLLTEQKRVIRLACPRETCLVVDQEYFKQVLHNVLSNAVRHGEGEIRIKVCTDGRQVQIIVLNRIGDARKPGVKGTGLGLRIITALVKAHPDGRTGFHSLAHCYGIRICLNS